MKKKVVHALCIKAAGRKAAVLEAAKRLSFFASLRGKRQRRSNPEKFVKFGDSAKQRVERTCPAASKAAFSLVEMLMALLVASLLMAALAPVITKRFSDNISVAGATGGGHAPAVFKCWDYDSPELQSAGDGSYKTLPEDYSIDDAWYANFIIVSGGGGGAGATTSETTEHDYDQTTELKIEPNMDEFDIVSLIGAGGGGGGGAGVYATNTCTGSPSNTKCECMGAKFDNKNNVCVSDNHGLKNLTEAKTACSSMVPGGKWAVPSYSQLGNWGSQYSNLGITTGMNVWSSDSATGECKTGGVECHCNGVKRTGRISEADCCTSECTYGTSNNPKIVACDYANGSKTFYLYNYGSHVAPAGYYCGRCPSGIYARNNCLPSSSACWSDSQGCPVDTCKSTINGSCAEYYTNYKYYQLSGSSWSGNYTTSASDTKSTFCVYNGTENVAGNSFYSLSGGGGGGAPGIQDNSFDSNILNTFRQKIKENPGGYIVFERGEGGKGGAKASGKNQKAGDGEKGKDSCIFVTDSSHNNKFKICAPGGNGGLGADAKKENASTEGWGGGAPETKLNTCYAVEYLSDGTETSTVFDCTKKGNPGNPGGASTDNPTPGGKGAPSILNASQAGGTAVKDGVDASSANYGAGGGGGSATKTGYGSSATLAFGAGGKGADGYIKIHYKIKYEAAGGGGGGSGYLAHVKKIYVGKSTTCNLTIGRGGAGGAAGSMGYGGGESSVTCQNPVNTTYRVTGGKGGQIGISASPIEGNKSVGGKGGEGGKLDDTGNVFARLPRDDFDRRKSASGADGGSLEIDSANYKENTRSAGGGGGFIEGDSSAKCGGLFNSVVHGCASVSADSLNDIPEPRQDVLNGQGFIGGDISIPTKDSIVEAVPKYGKAGAGGGGGAWHKGKDPGRGGAGQGGYVCIYWDKLE